MKAYLNRYMLMVAALFAVACTEENSAPEVPVVEEVFNQMSFSVSDGYEVTYSPTKSDLDASLSVESGDGVFTVSGHPRYAIPTRSSYNDVFWDSGEANVGIYVIEHMDDSEVPNATVDNVRIFGDANDVLVNMSADGSVIQKSSDKLLKNVKYYVAGNNMHNKAVDVLAYFPIATEIIEFVSLANTEKSVVGLFKKNDPAHILGLQFSMKPTQTDDNIWFHDLMVSQREDAGVVGENGHLVNLYGNKNKMNRSAYDANGTITGYYDFNGDLVNRRAGKITCDNVHLRMVHKFSLLNITIKHDSRYVGSTVERLYLSGSRVYTYGRLNLLTGAVTPGIGSGSSDDEGSTIDRLISIKDATLTADPLVTNMMACPCTIDGEGQFVLNIVIDGIKYSCDFYKLGLTDQSLKEGYAYDISLTFRQDATLLVENGYGGTVQCAALNPAEVSGSYGEQMIVPENTSDYPYNSIGQNARYLIAQPKDGWTVKGIYVNGEPVANVGEKDVTTVDGYATKHFYCALGIKDNKNTVYRVVYRPLEQWYAQPNSIIQQFDGIHNTGFARGGTDPTTFIWKDISGRGHDAHLQNVTVGTLNDFRDVVNAPRTAGQPYYDYPSMLQSGWVPGGLKLDGINDYVTFPAVLPARDDDPETGDFKMTIDMYAMIEGNQAGKHPRLLCEAEPGTMAGTATYTTHGYPSFVVIGDSDRNSNRVALLGETNAVYYMGFGHNNGYPYSGFTTSGLPNGKSSFMAAPSAGDRFVHFVLWYRGGYGELTDMDIFKISHANSTLKSKGLDLGGGDPRNAAVMMLEYVNKNNSITRKFFSIYADKNSLPADTPAQKLAAVDEALAFVASIVNDPNASGDKATKILTGPLAIDYVPSQQANISYLEDPFLPSERWACIGGRPNDYSRQFNGIVFSFMMYEDLLTLEDAYHNFDVHKSRFGNRKTNIPSGLRQ